MRYVKGNALECKELYLVHGCNALGAMGAGIAKAIRDRWPQCYNGYKTQIEMGLGLGGVSTYVTPDKAPKYIGNLITQEGVGGVRAVNYAAITHSLILFIDNLRSLTQDGRTLEIATPRIGAGLGGGDWAIIETLLKDIEQMMGVEFVVYDL